MPELQVPNEILRLSIDDRMELVTKIWDSIEADCGKQPLSDAQAQMLDQRIAEADAEPSALIPAAEVFRELREK